MTGVPVVDVPVVDLTRPPPPPPALPRVEEEDDVPAYREPAQDKTLEDLRGNIEFEIKRAGEPVDALVAGWAYFAELDRQVEEDGLSRWTAWDRMRRRHAEVQRQLGEASGYRAALSSSVLAFALERRRRE